VKLVCSTVIAFSCLLFGTAMANDLSDAYATAQAGYKNFLRVPLQQKDFCEEHSITKNDSNGTITLGVPFQLHSMTPDHIRSFRAGIPVSQLSEKTNIYMFPVLFNGQPKLILDVCKFVDQQKFEISSLGDSLLCKELSAISASYKPTDGFSVQLIQNYQTGRYLFHIPQLDSENLTLIDTRRSSERSYKQLSLSSKIMEHMKILLQEKMK